MSDLYILQLQPSLKGLVRFLDGQGLNRTADEDLGYGLHAWLAAVFGDQAPRPFRLFADRGARNPPKLLGYTASTRAELLEHAATFAEPLARAVCNLDEDLLVSPMPAKWPVGRRYGFELLACPVARKSATGLEKDLFLHYADTAESGEGLSRADVYCEWCISQMERAAVVESVDLKAFRLVSQLRRPEVGGIRTTRRLIRPHALFKGIMRVADSEAFAGLLAGGIGRHRTFGYGMILLRPA